jgi:hypothetical protein
VREVIMHVDDSTPSKGIGAFLKSPTGIALCVFLAVAAFYLFTEHTAHTFGALPYLLILLCPIMHLFMHGGHGGHGDHSGHGDQGDKR